jgi:hypothetical protein
MKRSSDASIDAAILLLRKFGLGQLALLAPLLSRVALLNRRFLKVVKSEQYLITFEVVETPKASRRSA